MRKKDEMNVQRQEDATFEAFWLSALDRLPAETERALPDGLETRILTAVHEERSRSKARSRSIRWPAALASVAAAALVVWLVVPGFLQHKSNDSAVRDGALTQMANLTEEEVTKADAGMMVEDEPLTAAVGQEAAVEPESRAMAMPEDAMLQEAMPFVAETTSGETLMLTLKGGETIILQAEAGSDAYEKSSQADEAMYNSMEGATWSLTSMGDLEQIEWLDQLTRSDRRRFDAYLNDAFEAGETIVITVEK